MATALPMPEPFRRKIELDRAMALKVVPILKIKERRQVRRQCEVALLPAGGGRTQSA